MVNNPKATNETSGMQPLRRSGEGSSSFARGGIELIGTKPSMAKRPGYVGSALLRMHLTRGAGTGRKDIVPSVLEEKTPRLTRTHLACLVVIALIGSFLSAALLAPLATDMEWDGSKARTTYTSHGMIMIMSDAEFTLANGVTSGGSGTPSNPYVIENWEIDASAIGFGILIMDTTKYYVIRNVHVFAPGSFGINMLNAPHGTVEDCLLDDGAVGIIASDSDYMNITGNIVTNQDWFAVEVANGKWANISGNQFADNNFSAVALLNVENSTVSSNTILRTNMSGIMVLESNYTRVIGNNASDSPGMGLYLEMANDTLVRDNNFTMNQMYGLYLNFSTDVSIYHNRFIGNLVQAEVGNSTNVAWDNGYPDGGNYWSNYSGSDAFMGPDQDMNGADGIGDIPFITNGSGVDRYPWMAEDMNYIPEFATLLMPVLAVMLAIAASGSARRRLR